MVRTHMSALLLFLALASCVGAQEPDAAHTASSVEWLERHARSPVHYLVAKFEAHDCVIVGEVHEDASCFVQMETGFGGRRNVDWLTGEQLPRIC